MRLLRVDEATLELARGHEIIEVDIPSTARPRLGEEIRLTCLVTGKGLVYEASFYPVIVAGYRNHKTDKAVPIGKTRLELRPAIGADRTGTGTKSA